MFRSRNMLILTQYVLFGCITDVRVGLGKAPSDWRADTGEDIPHALLRKPILMEFAVSLARIDQLSPGR
jgi:hypothetical protein